MKWFVKVLRHYADFSGRARRTEYWMFTLFNVIFLLAWVFLMALLFAISKSGEASASMTHNVAQIIYFSYVIATLLPGIAVAVRRLHDLGKSGWMLLVGLIPLIGGIWLFVLMVIEGQKGENQYGADPKTSSETFTDHRKLKSAGVTLIVAAAMAILVMIINHVFLPHFSFGWLGIMNVTTSALLLAAGIFLLSEKTIDQTGKNGRYAFIILLIFVAISFIIDIIFLKNNFPYVKEFGWKPVIWPMLEIVIDLALALFAVSVLFIRQNKSLIRIAVVSVIVFAILNILWSVFYNMGIVNERYPYLNILQMYYILLPIAYIVLAATFYPRKAQPAAIESSSDATPQNETSATASTASAGVAEMQKQPKLRSFGKEVKGQYTYEYYAASSAEEAKQFLASCEVTKPFYYIQVETPSEGVWGLDKDGLFLVNLLPFQTNLSLAQCEGRYTSFPFSAIVMASKGITDNFVSNVVCGSCGHEWKDALRVKNKTIVKCPKCKKYNSVDTNNINVM